MPTAFRRRPIRTHLGQGRGCRNTVDPQHRRAVVGRRSGEGFALRERHARLKAEDERHRAPRHGPSRLGLCTNPVTKDRVIGQGPQCGGHLNADVRHPMPVEVKPPTRCESGQGRGQGRQPRFAVGSHLGPRIRVAHRVGFRPAGDALLEFFTAVVWRAGQRGSDAEFGVGVHNVELSFQKALTSEIHLLHAVRIATC